MANTFLTPKQLVQSMIDDAGRVVADMPIESVRILANYYENHPARIGFTGAIVAAMVMAAQERMRTP